MFPKNRIFQLVDNKISFQSSNIHKGKSDQWLSIIDHREVEHYCRSPLDYQLVMCLNIAE